jgi:hypothetical protein
VSADGRIGPLRVGVSSRTDVIRFAGRPDSERRGRYADYPPFDAVGYGCHGKRAATEDGLPRCTTVFYVDSRSGKLALLYTEDTHYVDTHGVHPGMSSGGAARALRLEPFDGCFPGFRFHTKRAFIVFWLGGKAVPRGDHVAFLVVHSTRLNPGVLDCIDS